MYLYLCTFRVRIKIIIIECDVSLEGKTTYLFNDPEEQETCTCLCWNDILCTRMRMLRWWDSALHSWLAILYFNLLIYSTYTDWHTDRAIRSADQMSQSHVKYASSDAHAHSRLPVSFRSAASVNVDRGTSLADIIMLNLDGRRLQGTCLLHEGHVNKHKTSADYTEIL